MILYVLLKVIYLLKFVLRFLQLQFNVWLGLLGVCCIEYWKFSSVSANISVAVKNAVFWDVAPCRSYVNRHFRETYGCSHLLTLVPRLWIFVPWMWRRYVPPKRRLTQDLHSATSQKTAFFIVTAMKTSNLTFQLLFSRLMSLVSPSVGRVNCCCLHRRVILGFRLHKTRGHIFPATTLTTQCLRGFWKPLYKSHTGQQVGGEAMIGQNRGTWCYSIAFDLVVTMKCSEWKIFWLCGPLKEVMRIFSATVWLMEKGNEKCLLNLVMVFYLSDDPLKHNGCYMQHLLSALTLTNPLHFSHRVYLWIPYHSQNKQQLFP
jgi:hypothetical protein